MKNSSLTRISLMLSLLIISAQFTIPIGPVSISLQSMMILLIGLILPKKQAMLTSILYLIAGLIGLPVFAQAQGGLHSVFLPSFGFILSFIPSAWLVAKISEQESKGRVKKDIQAILIGNLVIYFIGIMYMTFIFNIHLELDYNLWRILSIGLLPFIPADVIKSIVALQIARRLNKHLDR